MLKQITCRDCGETYEDRRENAGIVTTFKDDKKHVDTSGANCKHCGSGEISIRHHSKIRNVV